MAYGIINMGRGIQNNALGAMAKLDQIETRNQLAEDQMKQAQEAQEANTAGTLGGMGLQYDLTQGNLSMDAFKNTFGGNQAVRESGTQMLNNGTVLPSTTSGSGIAPFSSELAGEAGAMGMNAPANVAAQGIDTANKVKDVSQVLETANQVKDAAQVVDTANKVKDAAQVTDAAVKAKQAADAAQAVNAVSTVSTAAGAGETAAAGATFGPWGMLAGLAASFLINSIF